MAISILFIVAFLYLTASIFIGSYLRSLSLLYLRMARWILGMGVVIQWIFLIAEFLSLGSLQRSSLVMSHLSFTAIAALLIFILCIQKRALPVLLIALPATAFSLLAFQFYGNSPAKMDLPSVWLWTHIALMILGEVMFFLAAATGIAYLVAARQLRLRRGASVFTTMASLPNLDFLLGRLLVIGVYLLSFGILLGFFFAEKFWTGKWWLDAGVLFAGFTWCVYLFLLIMRQIDPSFRGRKSAIAAIWSFLLVAVLSMGINYIFHTRHEQLKVDVSESE